VLFIIAACLLMFRSSDEHTTLASPTEPPSVLADAVLAPVASSASGAGRPARVAAARQLSSHGEAAVPELRRVLQQSKEPAVRAAVIQGLGKAKDWRSMPELIEALDDSDPLVRGRAGAAVQKIMQAKFYFRAEDPPAKRAKVIAYIKRIYGITKANGDAHYANP
jgi:HEAT repeat protein